MFSRVVDFIFGCWHKHLSFPITLRSGRRRSGTASATGTYVVCLDCGKEFAYDWNQMKLVAPTRKQRTGLAEPVESYAAK